MDSHPKYSYDVGAEFQNFTIVGEAVKDEHGHKKYPSKCNCGEEYMLSKKQLLSKLSQCSTHCKRCVPHAEIGRNNKPVSYLMPDLGMRFIQGRL